MAFSTPSSRSALRRWTAAAACLLAVTAATTVAANPASAGNWPTKPLKFIVCFPPGNAADVMARSLGPVLSTKLGQPVVVENRGGAGGLIGMDAMVRAVPDDHTFGVCSLSPVTILPAVRAKMPYDVDRDIAPVALTNRGPMVLVVSKKSPFNTMEELLAHAQANPGKLSYAILGPGTISQMSTDAFKIASNVQAVEVSYKGSAQLLTDLIAGHVDFALDGAASAAAQVAAGNVKALSVSTNKRIKLLPDVPTMDESGIPGMKGFDYFGWVGFFAPSKTSPEVLARLNKEVTEALKNPELHQKAHASGQEIAEANTPDQFKSFMKADFERWSAVAKKMNIRIQD